MGRSLKKGPFCDDHLLKKVQQLNKSRGKRIIKTWSRRRDIFPETVGQPIAVHAWREDDPGRRTAPTGTHKPAQRRPAAAEAGQSESRTRPGIGGGSSAEDSGSRGSAVTLLPGSSRTTSSGSAANTLSQIHQSNIRMQDLANYARNPSDWHGAPPR